MTLAQKPSKAPHADCNNCPLRDSRGPALGAGSPTSAKFAIIGHAPGPAEVMRGKPFIGRNGSISDAMLKQTGHDRDDVWLTNLVLCRSMDAKGVDVPPPPAAIKACEPRLKAELQALQAPVVVTTGDLSARTMTGLDMGVGKLEGSLVRNENFGKWILPTFQPVYAEGEGGEMAASSIVDAYSRAAMYDTHPELLPNLDAEPDYQFLRTPRTVERALVKLINAPDTYALDTETDYAGDPNWNLLMVQIGTRDKAWVLDAKPLLNDPRCKALFTELMESARHTWVMHNASFDLQYLKHHFDVVPPNVEDSMALALCLTESMVHIGLKYLARRHLNAGFYEAEVNEGKIGPKNPMSNIDPEVLAKYGAWDVIYTRQLWDLLGELVEKEGNRELYETILLDAQKEFAEIEKAGILVDESQGLRAGREMQAQLQPLIKQIQSIAAQVDFHPSQVVKKATTDAFNPVSPKQRLHLFYDMLDMNRAWAPNVKTKQLQLTTGEEFYKENKGTTVATLAEDIYHIQKMDSTYVKGIHKFMHPDKRVRPSILLAGARTGRVAMRNPPMQTIPHDETVDGGEGGDRYDFSSIKAQFIAPPHYVFMEADYSALELYIAYDLSGDYNIIIELRTGDFHIKAASDAYEVERSAVTKKQRTDGKRVTYGIMYNITPSGLIRQIGGTWDENDRRIIGWLGGFPVFADWRLAVQEEALTTGILETVTGRKRRWSLVTPDNSHAIRGQASNFPIQSLANDLLLLSAIEVNRALRERGWGRVVLMVHDSIEMEIKQKHVREAAQLVHDIMTRPKFPTRLPYHPIEIKVGPSWGKNEVYEVEVPDWIDDSFLKELPPSLRP